MGPPGRRDLHDRMPEIGGRQKEIIVALFVSGHGSSVVA
jgi:hypothetical protein